MSEERLDGLIRVIYVLGGAALALSMALFLRSESLELSVDLVAVLQISWAALFYSLAAGAAAQFLALFDRAAALRRALRRLLAVSAFAAFLAGLALLAYASLVALADANSDDDNAPVDTRAL